jgi:phosphoserine aminotransferase
MANRIFNFSAGPCTLPLPALEKAQTEFVDYQGGCWNVPDRNESPGQTLR